MSAATRHILFVALALLAVFVTAAWGLPRVWLGSPLSVLPPVLICAAFQEEGSSWQWVAVAGGLARDALSLDPLGASILPLYVTGWLLNANRELLLSELVFAQAVLGLAVGAAVPLLTLGFVIASGDGPVLGGRLLWQWVVLTLSGGLLTPLMFRVWQRLEGWFAHPVIQTTSFREDREILRGKY
jgi:rod shape-determining protein MreD